jgi:hypothetical protein
VLNPITITLAIFYLLTGLQIASLKERADHISRARHILTVPLWPLEVINSARAHIYHGFAQACDRLRTGAATRMLFRWLGVAQTFDYRVRNFSRTDRFAHPTPGHAPYTAAFVDWTDTPGIAIFQCSDGHLRRIPATAVESDSAILPRQQLD